MGVVKGKILVIDDEEALLEACEETLSYHGYEVELRNRPEAGIEAVRGHSFDLVLIDLKMPGIDGLQVLRMIKTIDVQLVAVVVTAFPEIDTAVQAIREGAFDYLPKPFDPEQLLIVVERSLQQKRLVDENAYLRQALGERSEADDIVAHSAKMRQVMDLVDKVADQDCSVLIEGETGTGKEIIARRIHALSHRRDRPFLPIQCSTLPEHLVESELFGHERGAFTNAHARKQGLLEMVQGGTIFLDEISTTGLETQAKLLRVLQEHKVRRVGGQELVDIDIRVLSASNEDLQEAIAQNRFRQDLYYRLNVVKVLLPPLHERSEDIPLLVDMFIRRMNAKRDKPLQGIGPDALALLLDYAWPGNVRELQNIIERACLLATASIIQVADLPEYLHEGKISAPMESTLQQARNRFDRQYLRALLQECQGNVSRAAVVAGMHRSSFQRLLKKHDLHSEEFR
ncbi:MAG TPA: sigma-54-dependent Fis family transcriptional regulator [Candidatus Latescibacteria bacterium]|nr:sigma-54-dependent Fis family transcriptional regulator [Candidatus Handelsmanbacteria bacterium]HIL11444.1 sigma-54-dependent Fis family transcriptional regulator [Candidatus Latescibacterota bacterium]